MERFDCIIEKLCNCKITYISEEEFNDLSPDESIKFQSGGRSIAILHKSEQKTEDDFWEKYYERKKEIEHLRSFLEKTEERLDNENFVNKAKKDIVEKEYKKWWDCLSKISFLNNLSLDDIQRRIDLLKKLKDEDQRNS